MGISESDDTPKNDFNGTLVDDNSPERDFSDTGVTGDVDNEPREEGSSNNKKHI